MGDMTSNELEQHRRRRKAFGFNEYPEGRGRIKCAVCGHPVRDHEVMTFCKGRKK